MRKRPVYNHFGNEYSFPMEKNLPPMFQADDFNEFTVSKTSHLRLFSEWEYDLEFFGERYQPDKWPLKHYQDLLVFAFLRRFVPPGSEILEVGGGSSRLIDRVKTEYSCWNLDKLEGIGQGPTQIRENGFRLVRDYIGNFSPALPDHHFDFVFSISALEHVPDQDPQALKSILDDLNRVLKPGCYSLHCFDSIIQSDRLWTNKLVPYIFENENTLNDFISYEKLKTAPDLLILPESIYNERWLPLTKKPYADFGRPISINVLWKKPSVIDS